MDKSPIEIVEYLICGGIGSIFLTIIGHPLDTIKVRLQTMPVPELGEPPLYSGAFNCFVKTVRNEGCLSLYKGLTASLAGVVPIFAISFMSLGMGKQIFKFLDEDLKYLQFLLAGAFSGIFTVVVMAPCERFKCLLQVQRGSEDAPILYTGPIDCMIKLYKEGGIANIYKGTGLTLLRDIPASGAYFLVSETIMYHLKGYWAGGVAGGCAGMAYWLVGLPPDVLKSRIQTAPPGIYPHGMRSAFVDLMHKEGPLALYKGFVPVNIRAFPANMACFIGFRLTQDLLQYIWPTVFSGK